MSRGDEGNELSHQLLNSTTYTDRAVNARQREYYDHKFQSVEAGKLDITVANTLTNLWAGIRRRLISYDHEIGVEGELVGLHREWLENLSGKRVLDLGCYTGNPLSLDLAQRAGSYLGLDLSPRAVSALRSKLDAAGLQDARVEVGDFLESGFPDDSFDVVYARGVLHHFRNPTGLAAELHRILAPGGIVICYDPLQTEPINRLARAIYRPFQSDRDWEWPFTRGTFSAVDRYFQTETIQGWRGFSKFGLPLAMLPLVHGLGTAIGRIGWRLDRRLASRRGLWLLFCWNVTMKLRRRDSLTI